MTRWDKLANAIQGEAQNLCGYQNKGNEAIQQNLACFYKKFLKNGYRTSVV